MNKICTITNFDGTIGQTRTRKKVGRWLIPLFIIVLVISLWNVTPVSAATEAIPDDLMNRWKDVTTGEHYGEITEWVTEGQLILNRIHELESIKSHALAEAPETLAEIESLRSRFVELLKMVERYRISRMSPKELQQMRQGYLAEQQRGLELLSEERKALIARAEAMLLSMETNEFLAKYPQRAEVLEDFLFRLAELYYQDDGANFLQAFDQWNLDVETTQAKGEPIPERPKPDYTRAKQTYQRILDNYPHGKYVDDCLYNLAKLYENEGDTENEHNIIDNYQHLVNYYPESPHLSMAYLGIGDYHFFRAIENPEDLEPTMDQAISAYRSVLGTPDTLHYNDAYFKIGWANYRVNRFEQAVNGFTHCIETTLAHEKRLEPSEVTSFYQKSIRYLALLFTSKQWGEGGLENAARFVQDDQKRRDTYGKDVIQQMGEIHAKLFEWQQAIAAYDLYITLYPLNPDVVDVHEQKIDAMEDAGIRAVEEREVFMVLYGPDGAWRQANPDPVLGAQVDAKREMFLLKSTDEITTEAVQSGDPQALEKAVAFCHRFLEAFPESDWASNVHMNMAMMLYNPPLERYLDAYREFISLCWKYPSETEKREIAAKNTVAAASTMIENEKCGSLVFDQSQRDEIIQTLEIRSDFDEKYPNWYQFLNTSEILFCQALDNYYFLFPDGDKAPLYLWFTGKLFFDVRQFDMSRYWLLMVEDKAIGNETDVIEANKLILNGHIEEGDYKGIESRTRHLLEMNIDPEFKESVRIRLAEAIFQSADQLREIAKTTNLAIDHKDAGSEYKRVADEIPDFQYAGAALFNAGLEFTGGQDYQSAVDAYEQLEQQYPNSEFMDRTLYNHAYILATELDRPEQAAELYMRLFNQYPDSPYRSDALYNACQCYTEAGNTDKVVEVSQTFAATYPKAAEASSLLFGAALLMGQSANDAGADQIYAQFAQKFPDDPNAVRAHFKRGTFLIEQGDKSGARQEFQQAVDAYKRMSNKGIEGVEEVRPLASKSLFTILEWDYNTYCDIQFTPRSQLETKIREKKHHSEILTNGYDKLIAWSDAEAVAAMVRRAEILENYAETYRNQDPPSHRNPFEMGKQRLKIANDAVGYQELAIEEYDRILNDLPGARAGLVARSQTASADEKPIIDSLIADITGKQDYCRRKHLDLRLSNATQLHNTLNELLNLPDYESIHIQSQLKRGFNFWNGDVLPLVLQVIDLYQQTYLSADSMQDHSIDWYDRTRSESVSVVKAYLAKGENLTRKAVESYQAAISDYNKVLAKGDGAQLAGLEASEYAALADDLNRKTNIYAQATVQTGENLIPKLEGFGFPRNVTGALEDQILAFIVEYSNICEGEIENADAGLGLSRLRYAEEQTIVLEDAMFVFEQWILVWSQYQLDILKIGHQLVEKFSIVSNDANQILEKLAALDPANYGNVASQNPEH